MRRTSILRHRKVLTLNLNLQCYEKLFRLIGGITTYKSNTLCRMSGKDETGLRDQRDPVA
jgi:hypothetical protein